MSVEEDNTESNAPFDKLYFHKAYRQFKIGRFIFKKSYMRLTSEEDDKEFLDLINAPGFPQREAALIVEVNERARAASEKSVIRGSMNADDILTAKDKQRLTSLSSPSLGANQLAPSPAKPAGAINLSGFSLGNK